MKLADFLKLDGQSATALAAKCSVEVSTITRAARGDTMPNRKLMSEIFAHTNGRVTPNDFFGVDAASPRKRPSDTSVAA